MNSDPKRWQLIKDIVAEALELEAGQRESVIESACAEHADLAGEIRALVSIGTPEDTDSPRGILDDSALVAAELIKAGEASGAQLSEDALIGRQLGPYRILRKIGEGGMGLVFEAEQEHLARRVALKVLQGHWASENLRARFALEIETLGRLEHPGIARIYGSGRDEETGVLYFAMELVDGVPLTAHAKKLQLRQRVALLAEVCNAVQHAHLSGVIHRDLKPDNVLVDAAGMPKILDFGIARLVEDSEDYGSKTITGQLIGTLAYMSPEQVAGDSRRIDLRSDVYALGVLLYQVLSGRLPHDFSGKSLTASLRMISEEDAPKPSRLAPELHGDLELVMLSALAKDPARRYASAGELGDELRRVLTHQPIQVRAPNFGYLLARFVRRHRAASLLSLLLFLSLIAAVVGTSIGLVQADRERARVVKAAKGVRGINKQLLLLVGQIPPELFSEQQVVRELLARWESAIETGFADEPELQIEMLESLGWAQYNLGLWKDGTENLHRAVEGYEKLKGEEALPTLRARDRYVQCCSQLGVSAEQVRYSAESLARCRKAHGPEHARSRTALATYAAMLHGAGRIEEALKGYEEALKLMASDAANSLETLSVRSDYALALDNAKRMAEAEQQFRLVDQAFRKAHPGEYPERHLNAMIGLSQVLEERGAHGEALKLQRVIVERARKHWGEGQLRTLRQALRLAKLLFASGATQEAEELAAETAQLSKRHAPRSQESVIARNTWVRALLRQGENARAATEAKALLRDMQSFLPDSDARLWTLRENLANALTAMGRHAEAEKELVSVLELREQALGKKALSTLVSLNNLAWMLLQSGSPKQAAERYHELMQRADGVDIPEQVRATFRLNHGRALLAAGKRAKAKKALEQALTTLRKLPGTAKLQAKAEAALQELTDRKY
ncbi:MAG: hypothetical protein CSA62_08535 [Planctomycetota bacterium]|nr:MAG: hypothetical protein CSA62_08535 [Planctomycetota bacterium]